MFNFWAKIEGDIDELGAGGFFIGTGGFSIVEVLKLCKIFENLIIPYSIVNYYIGFLFETRLSPQNLFAIKPALFNFMKFGLTLLEFL